MNFVYQRKRFIFVMFVTAVCVLFLTCCRNINLEDASLKFRIFYLSESDIFSLQRGKQQKVNVGQTARSHQDFS